MIANTLESLVSLSARIGSNPNLVQAGGGNTSLKENGTLWIKASGKWLAHAAHDDMFVPVPMEHILSNLRSGEEKFSEYRTRSGAVLRPSVETTMHAVLPQRVVIHVHSVAAIAWAAQQNVQATLETRLSGLRWAWIPYIHPGVPLALRIEEEKAMPDVLLLGNHGLVVAADDSEAAERLLEEVERRLSVDPRPAPGADLASLAEIAGDSGWTPSPEPDLHHIATDRWSCQLAAGGTMYPDHCVYLGPAAPVLYSGEQMDLALKRYADRNSYEPAYLLVEGKGVLVSERLSRAGRELLGCLHQVTARIPLNAQVSYLDNSQVARLMNWDAEKYRISMATLQN